MERCLKMKEHREKKLETELVNKQKIKKKKKKQKTAAKYQKKFKQQESNYVDNHIKWTTGKIEKELEESNTKGE